MNIRLKCSCGARFTTSDHMLGRVIRCPKCRRRLRVPETMRVGSADSSGEPMPEFVTEDSEGAEAAVAPSEPPRAAVEPEEGDSTWRARASDWASGDDRRGGWWKWALLVLVVLGPVAAVGVLIVWPMLQPKDPRELVAQRYLDAIRREDWVEANRLSVLTAHPRPTKVEHVALTDRELPGVTGRLLGLSEFHARIDREYRYNAERGRFEPKDELGLGLNVLSNLEKAKKKVEEKAAESAAQPRRSRNPEDQMLDDALAAYGAIAELASGAGGLLSSQRLGPTYEDLLNGTDVPLSESERLLARHFAGEPAKWDRLLGRSFLTLPGGEFLLQESEIRAVIRTEGQSYGEPGKPITLRMIRFSMGTLDTGWRVWNAE